jgi:uncharacterized Zn finger protein
MFLNVNLNNFEEMIEERIVERGHDYYYGDMIAEFQNLGNKEFSAEVLGTEQYSVYVKLGYNNMVIEHSCSCPYDYGQYCKHEVAVLYHIKLNEEHLREGKPSPDLLEIQKELKNYTKDELIKFALDLAKRDRNLQRTMLGDLGLRG